MIQKTAAQVLTGTRKRAHISLLLASIPWLLVKSRIEFKLVLLAYKSLNGLAPSCLKYLKVPYYPIRSLRSENAGLFVVFTISKISSGR